MSIEDNIKYVNKNLSKKDAISLFKLVNFHDEIMSLDKKYSTIVNERINLSGGEKQRLGIVMALASNPDVLILDEPTSALDNKNEQAVINIIKRISKEKLVILVSIRKVR